MLPNPHIRQGRQASARAVRRPALNIIDHHHLSANLAVFKSPAAEAVTFPARLDGGAIEGTVEAVMPSIERHAYGPGSDALLSNAPFGDARHRKTKVPPALRASLIAELREISGQVNRMMSQVERAIHRLGEHAGEPLRR
jgi:hypothetical protein